jgi:hypothetical protein
MAEQRFPFPSAPTKMAAIQRTSQEQSEQSDMRDVRAASN